jgi:GNAT superfamily N-acetyltransferase
MMTVRPARPGDLDLICELIRSLADYQGLLHEVSFDPAEMERLLFGARPAAEVMIGEMAGEAQGFALFFTRPSTFRGQLVVHLEDLFVREPARRRGLGSRLLREVVIKARDLGCARVEWTVQHANEAAIRFYEASGASIEHDWRIVRLANDALADFGADLGVELAVAPATDR